MSNTNKNELIAMMDACRAEGFGVKAIRKQKFDPSNFYMTRSDGRQLGPVKCEGTTEQLNAKFGEAISYMNAMKHAPAKRFAAA